MPKYVLIGLCEPPEGKQEEFDEWFVGQHIEDTTKCPNFVSGRVFRLSGPHLDGETVSQYLSFYEVEAPSYKEAERVLNEWQADPYAWEGRAHHWATAERAGGLPLVVKGSGWYELIGEYTGPSGR